MRWKSLTNYSQLTKDYSQLLQFLMENTVWIKIQPTFELVKYRESQQKAAHFGHQFHTKFYVSACVQLQ